MKKEIIMRKVFSVATAALAMGRYKALIGSRLRTPGLAARQTEATIGTAVLKPDATAGRLKSVRFQRASAEPFGAGIIPISV